MPKKVRTSTTYVVHVTSQDRYGLNQDYYYRTEAEANRQATSLREWYKNVPSQNITQSSHQIQLT